MSVEDYLTHEREGDVRHEYVNGYVYALAERLAVRHIAKGTDGRWLQEDLTGDGDIPLPCPNDVLSLPQIYQGVFS